VKEKLEDLRAEDQANELTRILLIEDHGSFRQALAFMLEREPGFKVVGEAGSLAALRKLSGKLLKDVDVAVVDLALQDGDAFGLIEHFALNEPQVMILALSGSLESGYSLLGLCWFSMLQDLRSCRMPSGAWSCSSLEP
jgi:DNA-binding response OmpR family regulator